MPQILVTSGTGDAVLLRERVNVSDFESDHFAAHLVERLGWAVSDADELDRSSAEEVDGDDERPADERPAAERSAAERRPTNQRSAKVVSTAS